MKVGCVSVFVNILFLQFFNMEISLATLPSVCRVCLTQAKNLVHLSDVVCLSGDEEEFSTICHLLETVTNTRIVLSKDKFPSHLCQMCLSMLKLSYKFTSQFKASQSALEELIGEVATEDFVNKTNDIQIIVENSNNTTTSTEIIKDPPPDKVADVELVIGGRRAVDLRDVVVVEEEKPETHSYAGFLRNLGQEVSATFVTPGFTGKTPAAVDTNTKALTIQKTVSKSRYPGAKVVAEIDVNDLHANYFDDNNTGEDFDFSDSKTDTLHVCSGCNNFFSNTEEVTNHIEECPEYKATQKLTAGGYVCEICGYVSLNQMRAYRHMVRHKGRCHKCPHEGCDKAYYTATHLKNHLMVHTDERPFLCNFCAKSFQYMNALQYHMRLHTGEKKYVCNFCGLRYTMPQSLKRHIRTHTKEKPYTCTYCENKFCSRSEQIAHEMVHTKQMKYFCEYCDKGFTKTGNRLVHYLSHEGPLQCNICLKGFVTKRVLDLHVKKRHTKSVERVRRRSLMYDSQEDNNMESS